MQNQPPVQTKPNHQLTRYPQALLPQLSHRRVSNPASSSQSAIPLFPESPRSPSVSSNSGQLPPSIIRITTPYNITHGWKSGYPQDKHHVQLPNPTEVQKKAKTLQHDSAISLSVTPLASTSPRQSIAVSSTDLVETSKDQDQLEYVAAQMPSRLSISVETIIETIQVQIKQDLSGILQGTHGNVITRKYHIKGCIAQPAFGFILCAKMQNKSTNPFKLQKKTKPEKNVFIKAIHTKVLNQLQKYVNPLHSDLQLLIKRDETMPEYIEHFYDGDYLVLITKTHGVRVNKGLKWLVGAKYHDVEWLYYFSQAI